MEKTDAFETCAGAEAAGTGDRWNVRGSEKLLGRPGFLARAITWAMVPCFEMKWYFELLSRCMSMCLPQSGGTNKYPGFLKKV